MKREKNRKVAAGFGHNLEAGRQKQKGKEMISDEVIETRGCNFLGCDRKPELKGRRK